MTNATRILKADNNASARPVVLSELSEVRTPRFTTSDFELLSIPSIVPSRKEPRVDAQWQSALSALNYAAQQLHAQRDRWLEQCQEETVRLGIAIAERLLRRTLDVHPEAVIDLVRSALECSVGTDQVRIRLHPADAELVTSLQTESSVTLDFVEDDSLERGDCIIETSNGQIDARREMLTQRIAEELLM